MSLSWVRRYLWIKKDGPFGKEFPVYEGPTPDSTSGYSDCNPIYSSSEVPISRTNTEGIVKRIRQIANTPPYPDAEGGDELDGEEAEVVRNSAGHPSNTSPSQPPAKSSPVPPATSNPLLLQFLLPFLLVHHTFPTPGLP
ncbi:hypothetical protein O181_085703 [Austropuccinia psidii MF-1]|uniref:Uncharacterized protein n=1 Tax=Austropuccinia psidii MF-1 TaxID=1389203 RepID=A0A9Q3FTM0_9BASI|nr:hypothetical protein [Austropuccinia psidii MF-1]